jgi:hypothetical protein
MIWFRSSTVLGKTESHLLKFQNGAFILVSFFSKNVYELGYKADNFRTRTVPDGPVEKVNWPVETRISPVESFAKPSVLLTLF